MKNLMQSCLVVVMICSVFLSDQVHSYPSVDESKRGELIQNSADNSNALEEQVEEIEKRHTRDRKPSKCQFNGVWSCWGGK